MSVVHPVPATVEPYQLLAFGEGRKIERFGSWIIDRPEPVATTFASSRPFDSIQCSARYTGSKIGAGAWDFQSKDLSNNTVDFCLDGRELKFELHLSDSGQVGLFPEHIAVAKAASAVVPMNANVLNVFGYTGFASTALAVTKQAAVIHVDASSSAIAQCQRNANINGLQGITTRKDDALAVLKRLARKGTRFDCIIADPPAFGRFKNKTWKLERDLHELVSVCSELLTPDGVVFLSGHSTGFEHHLERALLVAPQLRCIEQAELFLMCGNDKLHKGTCFVLGGPSCHIQTPIFA